MKKILIISMISLISLLGLFQASAPAQDQPSDTTKQEKPQIENPDEDESTENEEEPDVDEKGLEELDPWFFENDGKGTAPTEKDTKEQKQQKEETQPKDKQ